MAERDVMAIARETIDGFNASKPERYKATLASDVVYDEVATQRHIKGVDAVAECWEAWRKAMPDVKGTITNAITSGETVLLEVTWSGTQTGPLVGPGGTIPPSGKRQETRAAFLFAFRGSKVQELRHYFDMMALLQQLGAVPR
jgi:steroid delta-isomerase-like uncharacterized protein